MRWLAILSLILAPALITACDPGSEITWINQTDKQLEIYLGDDIDDLDVRLAPQSTEKVDTIKAVWEDVVVVRDQRGNILLRQEMTWDELKAQDFRFVISDDMLQEGS